MCTGDVCVGDACVRARARIGECVCVRESGRMSGWASGREARPVALVCVCVCVCVCE